MVNQTQGCDAVEQKEIDELLEAQTNIKVRLREIDERLVRINTGLHGPRLEDDEKQCGPPIESKGAELRKNNVDIYDLLEEVEKTIGQIERFV